MSECYDARLSSHIIYYRDKIIFDRFVACNYSIKLDCNILTRRYKICTCCRDLNVIPEILNLSSN